MCLWMTADYGFVVDSMTVALRLTAYCGVVFDSWLCLRCGYLTVAMYFTPDCGFVVDSLLWACG